MDDNDPIKVYGIASRLNGAEYFIVNRWSHETSLIAYHTFRKVRSVLNDVYKTYFSLVGKDDEIPAWRESMTSVVVFYQLQVREFQKIIKLMQQPK